MTRGLLAAELALDRPAHAYLLTGPDEDSLRAAAVLIAQALNCTAPRDDGPCGECTSCREIAAGVFADLHIGEPRLKLAEVKAQLALCVEKPFVGRRRVVVLTAVPEMTREAQNVLLKTLEEPPPSAVLVLTAPGVEGILPTVISRCRHIPVPGPTAGELAAGLGAGVRDLSTVAFAALAAGSDRALAERLLAREDLAGLRAEAAAFVAGALGDRREPALELVERCQAHLSPAESLGDWLAALRGVLRAVLLAGTGDRGTLSGAFSGGEAARLAALPASGAALMVEAVQTVEAAAARRAAARLSLEAALLAMNEQLDGGPWL